MSIYYIIHLECSNKEQFSVKCSLKLHESGSIQHVSLDAIESIGQALHIPPGDLVGWHSYKSIINELAKYYSKLTESDREIITQLIDRLTNVQ